MGWKHQRGWPAGLSPLGWRAKPPFSRWLGFWGMGGLAPSPSAYIKSSQPPSLIHPLGLWLPLSSSLPLFSRVVPEYWNGLRRERSSYLARSGAGGASGLLQPLPLLR